MTVLQPPYQIVMKPYGRALVEAARVRPNLICLGADLTRQTETDIFRDELPERFINVGMSEANLIGIAGGLARSGHVVFVNTFGVFCTRRCFDQLAMAVAYPALNVKIVGFMPGLSSPGGPSHQAIEDIALMRSLPNMKVLDLADATEISQAVALAADEPGPVYLRLKRGEIPAIFGPGHRLSLRRAHVLQSGSDIAIVASGMMVPAALVAADVLGRHGISVAIVNTPVIKPLDTETIVSVLGGVRSAIVAENHSVIGGLGSAVAECVADHGLGVRLRRIGVADTFAESGSREYLFKKYGLGVDDIVGAAWDLLGLTSPRPESVELPSSPGAYAPV